MNKKEQALAFAIMLDIVILGLVLFLSGGIQTITGGNSQVEYNGPSTTTIYQNGTEVSTSVSHLVPMSSTEVVGLWMIFIGGILMLDYFLLTIGTFIPKQVCYTIKQPLTPEAIDDAVTCFKLRLKYKSDELARENKA